MVNDNQVNFKLVFKQKLVMQRLGILCFCILVICSRSFGQATKESGVLILVADSATNTYGYKSGSGKIAVPMGKYPMCFTDTFRSYAIVLDSRRGFIAIDRQYHVLYNVFIFDNGPDPASGGLFRIQVAGKIGYADITTGSVAIKPQFACAWPFENGMAKVAIKCQTRQDGEHSTWISDEWFYINKAGRLVNR
jgi:hypothetical protein